MDISALVDDFAAGMLAADHRRPQAVNQRSGSTYQVGLGPHTEANTVELVMAQAEKAQPVRYQGRWETGVKYLDGSRQKCDLCLGREDEWDWAVEIKMIRMLGDNGKPNDNLPSHILSPYPKHRSALTDCTKLLGSELGERKAILMYGYDYEEWPLEPLLMAFELLASQQATLGPRVEAEFEGLVHPVHQRGAVMAWELQGSKG